MVFTGIDSTPSATQIWRISRIVGNFRLALQDFYRTAVVDRQNEDAASLKPEVAKTKKRSSSPEGRRQERSPEQDRDKKRRRSRSRSGDRAVKREDLRDDRRHRSSGHRGRSRSRSPNERSRNRPPPGPSRNRSPGAPAQNQPPPMPDAPVLGGVYRGKVTGVLDAGCFVELSGFRAKCEGMVHVTNLSKTKVNSAKDVVKRGEEVWIKVLSLSGQRNAFSIRDVDQKTGRDLLPGSAAAAAAMAAGGSGLTGLSGITVKDEDATEQRRPRKRLTSPERWEITQLIKSGVMDVTELPNFDEEQV